VRFVSPEIVHGIKEAKSHRLKGLFITWFQERWFLGYRRFLRKFASEQQAV
jgi:hypothetical protein